MSHTRDNPVLGDSEMLLMYPLHLLNLPQLLASSLKEHTQLILRNGLFNALVGGLKGRYRLRYLVRIPTQTVVSKASVGACFWSLLSISHSNFSAFGPAWPRPAQHSCNKHVTFRRVRCGASRSAAVAASAAVTA